jgi:DNA invertase Pin-like site-specific DNA recombinase
VSGSFSSRRGLDAALNVLESGDALVVWKLDRLGRSLAHLVSLVADLGARGISFRSLSDPIDTTSAGGRLILHIMGALSEFERSLIIERTRAGIEAAKQRGVKLGRRPTLAPHQLEHVKRLIACGETPKSIARSLKIGRSTLYRYLQADQQSE